MYKHFPYGIKFPIGSNIGSDVNFGDYYALALQNIPDLAAKGAGYWFDGVDDLISLSAYTFTANHTMLFSMTPDLNSGASFIGRSANYSYFRFTIGSETTAINGETDTDGDAISFVGFSFEEGINTILTISQGAAKDWTAYQDGKLIDTDTTTDADFIFDRIGSGKSDSFIFSSIFFTIIS